MTDEEPRFSPSEVLTLAPAPGPQAGPTLSALDVVRVKGTLRMMTKLVILITALFKRWDLGPEARQEVLVFCERLRQQVLLIREQWQARRTEAVPTSGQRTEGTPPALARAPPQEVLRTARPRSRYKRRSRQQRRG